MLDFLVENTQEVGSMADKYAETKGNYDKEYTRMASIKLNIKTDADILEKLDSIENRQGYIKALIRADINNQSPILTEQVLEGLRAIKRALNELDI